MQASQSGADEADEDLAAFGAPEEIRAQLAARTVQEDVFDVWPENWEIVQLFLACQTQWRVAAAGGVIGLDYGAVDVVMRHRAIVSTPELFAGLQAMEVAALKELNRNRD